MHELSLSETGAEARQKAAGGGRREGKAEGVGRRCFGIVSLLVYEKISGAERA
jgi:hypothetical protein